MLQTISRRTFLLVISATLLLSGCGFHLRGQIEVPAGLERLHIVGEDIELNDLVEKSLRFSGIEIVEAGSDSAVLDLSNSSYTKEVIGTDGNGIANNYKMTYTVNYVVTDAQGEKLQSQRVSQDRSLVYDANNILVFEREEAFLVKDMRQELVNTILRRMSKINK